VEAAPKTKGVDGAGLFASVGVDPKENLGCVESVVEVEGVVVEAAPKTKGVDGAGLFASVVVAGADAVVVAAPKTKGVDDAGLSVEAVVDPKENLGCVESVVEGVEDEAAPKTKGVDGAGLSVEAVVDSKENLDCVESVVEGVEDEAAPKTKGVDDEGLFTSVVVEPKENLGCVESVPNETAGFSSVLAGVVDELPKLNPPGAGVPKVKVGPDFFSIVTPGLAVSQQTHFKSTSLLGTMQVGQIHLLSFTSSTFFGSSSAGFESSGLFPAAVVVAAAPKVKEGVIDFGSSSFGLDALLASVVGVPKLKVGVVPEDVAKLKVGPVFFSIVTPGLAVSQQTHFKSTSLLGTMQVGQIHLLSAASSVFLFFGSSTFFGSSAGFEMSVNLEIEVPKLIAGVAAKPKVEAVPDPGAGVPKVKVGSDLFFS